MINELFIKISGYKTLQHFSLSACPPWPSLLAIDKTFLCVKNMEMDEKQQNFATQFLFYAMLFEWYKNIRFRL